MGFLGAPLTRVSKCRCGPVLLPVLPTYPITSPMRTKAPSLAPMRDMCA